MEKMLSEVTGIGRPLVLVPGGLTGWLSWKPHAERLSSSRKVARVQLLNVQCGLEGRALPKDYSVKTESGALRMVIEELGWRVPIDYVSWSYGGLITLDFALDHPDMIRTLTLIEPPAFWILEGRFDEEAKSSVAALRKLRGEISEEQLEEFLKGVGMARHGESLRQLPQWPLWARHRQSLRNTPAAIDHKDDVKRLRQLRSPVLLVKGTGSAKLLHQITDALAAHLPNAQVIEMPSGHAPQNVSIDLFLERLRIFTAGESR